LDTGSSFLSLVQAAAAAVSGANNASTISGTYYLAPTNNNLLGLAAVANASNNSPNWQVLIGTS